MIELIETEVLTESDLYLDVERGRTRLYDGPVLNVPFPNNETFKKRIVYI